MHIATIISARLELLPLPDMSVHVSGLTESSGRVGVIEPIEVSMIPPQVEQSLRLLSFQRMASLSICWGRVIQKSAEGMLLVNIYGDSGSSGGALVDREGKLVGVLSMSTLGKQVAYVEPVVPIMRVVRQNLARKQMGTQSIDF